jgi:molybdopterin biosynthesis enzyme
MAYSLFCSHSERHMPNHHAVEPKPTERKRYLKKKSLPEALSVFLGSVTPPHKVQTVAVEDSLHRTTAEPIFAALSAPHYHGSAMDGIAVRAEDTFGASEFSAVTLTATDLKAGAPQTNGKAIFQYVDTGNPLPTWANAVVMIERVFKKSDHEVEIRDASTPWQHVRLVGEDIVATEPLLPRGH